MANENKTAKEYVQKGYLIAHLANCGIQTINYDEWERLCERIHEAKPADVVPVVHGEWIWSEHNQRVCSNCQCPVGFVPKDDGWHEANYCPNCGADMRGGK